LEEDDVDFIEIDDLKEIKRVLRSGGTLLMANEAYEHERFAERNARWVHPFIS
jgi:hypothetical protein